MRRIAAGVAALLLALPTPSIAEGGKITTEFNDLQQTDAGCRAVFVLNNGLDKALGKVTLRVVAFNKDKQAKLFLSLDVGNLPVGKTRVLRFDLGDGLACKDVGRLVLDDVTSCEGAEIGPPECLAALALSSLAGPPFDF
jgi:hypothetical protein